MSAELSSEDWVALERLVVEWLWRIDHDRDGEVGDLLDDDAVVPLNHGWGDLVGRDAIVKWMTDRVDASKTFVTRHARSNQRFVADGPDRAEGDSVVMVYLNHRGHTAPASPTIGEYHQKFVRRADGWKIAYWGMETVFPGPATFEGDAPAPR